MLYGSKRIAVLGERELDILSVYQAAKLLFGVKTFDISFISQIEIRVDEGIWSIRGQKK